MILTLKIPNLFSKPSTSLKLPLIPTILPILRGPFSPFSEYVVPRLMVGRKGESIHLDRAASLFPRAVIVGPPGSGKTSALHFLGGGADVLSISTLPPGALVDDSKGEGPLIFDDARESHWNNIEKIGLDSPKKRIYVATIQSSSFPADYVTLSLQPLNEREISTIAEAWFPPSKPSGHGGFKVVSRAVSAFMSALKTDQRTRLLASNPLNLFLLLQIYTPGTKLPAHRSQLFDTFVSSVIATDTATRVSSNRGPSSNDSADFAARALEGIALATKRGELAKSEHLDRSYGFLRPISSSRVDFVHPLFQDLFAARALRRNPDLEPLLEHAPVDDWREVLLFYAGLGDPRPLIEALLERDLFDLAASALAEATDIPEDLQKRITEPLIRRAWEQKDTFAISGLTALRSNAATDFLAARLKDRDPEARTRAAQLLGRLNTDRSIEYLLPQLRDIDAGVRDQVVASLGQSTNDRVIEPLLVALRGDTRVGAVDTRMRVAAARALGEVGTERAVPALIVDLQVGEPEVRAEAVKALIKIRSELARKPLLFIADTNPSSEVRSAAVQVLESA